MGQVAMVRETMRCSEQRKRLEKQQQFSLLTLLDMAFKAPSKAWQGG
jgi:hypothetical protein